MEINLNYQPDENTKATVMAAYARLRYPDAAVLIRLARARAEHNVIVIEGGQRQYRVERELVAGLRDLAAQ